MRRPLEFSVKVKEILTTEKIETYENTIFAKADEGEQRFCINYINIAVEHLSSPVTQDQVVEIIQFIDGFLYPELIRSSSLRNHREPAQRKENLSRNPFHNFSSPGASDSDDSEIEGTTSPVSEKLKIDEELLNAAESLSLSAQPQIDEKSLNSSNSSDIAPDRSSQNDSSVKLTPGQKKRARKKARKKELRELQELAQAQEKLIAEKSRAEEQITIAKAKLVSAIEQVDFSADKVGNLKSEYTSLIFSFFGIESDSPVKQNPKFNKIPISLRSEILLKINDTSLLISDAKSIGAFIFAMIPEFLLQNHLKQGFEANDEFPAFFEKVDDFLIKQLNDLIDKEVLNPTNCLTWLYHFQLVSPHRNKYQTFTSCLIQKHKIDLANCSKWLNKSRELEKGDKDNFAIEILRHSYLLRLMTPFNAHLWAQQLKFTDYQFVEQFVYNLRDLSFYKFSDIAAYFDVFVQRFQLKPSIVADIIIFGLKGEPLPKAHLDWKVSPDKYEAVFIVMMYRLVQVQQNDLATELEALFNGFKYQKYLKDFLVDKVLAADVSIVKVPDQMEKQLSSLKILRACIEKVVEFGSRKLSIIELAGFIHSQSKAADLKLSLENFVNQESIIANVFKALSLDEKIELVVSILGAKIFANEIVFSELSQYLVDTKDLSSFARINNSISMELKCTFLKAYFSKGLKVGLIDIENIPELIQQSLVSNSELIELYQSIVSSLKDVPNLKVSDLKRWHQCLIQSFTRVVYINKQEDEVASKKFFAHLESSEAFTDIILEQILKDRNLNVFLDAKPSLLWLMLNKNLQLTDIDNRFQKTLKQKIPFTESLDFAEDITVTEYLPHLNAFLKGRHSDLHPVLQDVSNCQNDHFFALVEQNVNSCFATQKKQGDGKKKKKQGSGKKGGTSKSVNNFFEFWQKCYFVVKSQQYIGEQDLISVGEVNKYFVDIALSKELISNSESLVNFFQSSPLSPLEFYQEITKSLLKQSNISITDFRLWQNNLRAFICMLYPENLHNVVLSKQYDCLNTILLESDLTLSSFSSQDGLFKQIQNSDIDHSDKLLLSVILFNLKEKYSFDNLNNADVRKLNNLFQNFLGENPEITFPDFKSQDFKVLQTMLSEKTHSCAIC